MERLDGVEGVERRRGDYNGVHQAPVMDALNLSSLSPVGPLKCRPACR